MLRLLALLLTAASLPLWHEALVALGAANDAQQVVVATLERAEQAAALEKMQSLLRHQTLRPNPKGDFTPPPHRLRLD